MGRTFKRTDLILDNLNLALVMVRKLQGRERERERKLFPPPYYVGYRDGKVEEDHSDLVQQLQSLTENLGAKMFQ